jgi:hypothetical protein
MIPDICLMKLAEHEQTGVDLMTSFQSRFIEEDMIGKISDCIMATRIPSDPKR